MDKEIAAKNLDLLKKFLMINGFLEVVENFLYSNEYCQITVLNNSYEIITNDLEFGYLETNGYSLPEIIGYLTYYGLIDRNYKII